MFVRTLLRAVILSCLSFPTFRGHKPSRFASQTTLKAVAFPAIPDPVDPPNSLVGGDSLNNLAKPPMLDVLTSALLKTEAPCNCLFHYWLMMTAVHWKSELDMNLKYSLLILVTFLCRHHFK